MDKPITVARQEFMENLVKICNESVLPAFVKYEIFNHLCDAIYKRIDVEYQQDLETYTKGLQENVSENQEFHTDGVKMNG